MIYLLEGCPHWRSHQMSLTYVGVGSLQELSDPSMMICICLWFCVWHQSLRLKYLNQLGFLACVKFPTVTGGSWS